MGTVSVAVGCAVGIPIGVGVLVAFYFWLRLQRRYKREEEEDKELEHVIHDDNGFISFENLHTLQQSKGWDDKTDGLNDTTNENSEIFEEQKHPEHHIAGSGSSDGSLSHEEKTPTSLSNNQKGISQQIRPKKRDSRQYTPAYRRKFNAFQAKLSNNEISSTNNSSSASLNSSQRLAKRQASMYDQMIPIATDDGEGVFDESSSKKRQLSNEHLIKNLNSQDYGSYYPRRASTSSLNQLNSANQSSSSFHTRASSVNSLMKPGAGVPPENVFGTPKSEKALNSSAAGDDDKIDKHDGVYLLKNNYDITNTGEIAEEDQYENEFTNYSENKREFIDSLRPKKL